MRLREQSRAGIARDILPEIRGRLDFLQQVGLSCLSLDRAAPTLSGGEAQRIRIAAHLGYDAGRFSFSTKEGRCAACEGQGVKRSSAR